MKLCFNSIGRHSKCIKIRFSRITIIFVKSGQTWTILTYIYCGQDYRKEFKRTEVSRELKAKALSKSKTRDLEEQCYKLYQRWRRWRSTKLDFL